MTMNQWTDSAKAFAGILLGNPDIQAKYQEQENAADKVKIEKDRLLLEQALNPAKISQAEAAAAYNNAQAKTEAILQEMKRFQLDNQKLDLQGDYTTGMGSPGNLTPAPVPKFNPYNVGPQGQGSNPAIFTNYADIKPVDAAQADDLASQLDMSTLPPAPKGPVPLSMANLSLEPPTTADPFGDLITNLTKPAEVNPVDMLPPALRRSRAASGNYDPKQVADFLLAQEGFNANQGVTDPNKRILNSLAGTGTIPSPDQVTAQAMGSTLPTARLSELGVQNMGTADIKNFRETQANPDFATFLAQQNAGQEIEFNPDGTVKRIGKGGKEPKTTEQDRRVSLISAQTSPGVAALMNIYNNNQSSSLGNLAVKAVAGEQPLATDLAQRVGAINAQDQIINTALKSVMKDLYIITGAAKTDDEVADEVALITPLASDTPDNREFKKALLEQKVRGIIYNSDKLTQEQKDEQYRSLQGIWLSQIPGSKTNIGGANGIGAPAAAGNKVIDFKDLPE